MRAKLLEGEQGIGGRLDEAGRVRSPRPALEVGIQPHLQETRGYTVKEGKVPSKRAPVLTQQPARTGACAVAILAEHGERGDPRGPRCLGHLRAERPAAVLTLPFGKPPQAALAGTGRVAGGERA
jgi:hypothetical protein